MIRRFLFYLLALGAVLFHGPAGSEAQDDQVAADKRKVDVLMRLTNIDVEEKPKLKAAVVRFLKTVSDESEFLGYAKRFPIEEVRNRLWSIAFDSKNNGNRVQALELLIAQTDDLDRFRKKILEASEAVAVVESIGLISSRKTLELLKSLVVEKKFSSGVRNAAVKGLGRQKPGQEFLLQLELDGKLPEDCRFSAANILLSSSDDAIRQQASRTMKLPATANSKPLAPIGELVGRTGDAARGKEVFVKKGTCANCHKVNGSGKEVGPDLSEIGSKLSRQAMYESILNPSLAVSHNYETYLIQTLDGLSSTGILLSETDDKVVIRTAEAISREFAKEDIEGMKKSKKSLMPADLQKNFSEEELVDLVEYLMSLKKKQ